MKVLTNIVSRIKSVFNENYSEESEDFKRGWRCCQLMYEIAINKHIREISREFEGVNIKNEIKRLRREVNTLKDRNEKVSRKLNKTCMRYESEVLRLKSNPVSVDWSNDNRIKKLIHALSKRNSIKFITRRKEEKKRLTEMFNRYLKINK